MARRNNFNLIRVLAACAVIVSHSYALTGHRLEPMEAELGYSLGTLAVKVFFALSGYLIYKSFCRSSLAEYFVARVLRLWPGLLGAALFALFIVGPAYSVSDHYFSSSATWAYIPVTLTLPSQTADLPGLFIGSSNQSTNGVLWTLHYEAAWYCLTAVAGLIGFRYFRLFLLAFGAVSVVAPSYYTIFGLPFVVGMSLAHYKLAMGWRAAVGAVAVAVFAFALKIPFAPGLSTVTISYIAIWAGARETPYLRVFNYLGDYSYGVYIYGWLVQQMVISTWHLSAVQLAVISTSGALMLAIVSWHLIEAPALRLRRTLTARSTPQSSPSSPLTSASE